MSAALWNRPRDFRAVAAWIAGASLCVHVGCSAGELHLLPEAAGGESALPGEGVSDDRTSPPADCISPECETVACHSDPACKNDCKTQLAQCSATCTRDEDCPPQALFCDQEVGHCTPCTRHDHCLSLYRGARSVCSDGMCLPCAAAAECPGGVECEGGRCGECFLDEDCMGNTTCVDYRCQG